MAFSSKKYLSFLKKPIAVLLALGIGVILGLTNKEMAKAIFPLGDIYLSLLRMCVFPILITAIITSVGQLFRSENAQFYIKRIIAVFVVLLFLTSFLGISMGVIGQPGKGLSQNARETLGSVLIKSDAEGDEIATVDNTLVGFVKAMIPVNIFDSLRRGASLQILFFSLILGVTVGLLPAEYSTAIILFSEALFKAFIEIINGVMYLLPLGLICLVSGQIANAGVDILLAMTKFVVIVYISSFILVIISSIIIWYSTKNSIISSLAKLKNALLIAFGTQSTFASMPAALDGLTNGLKVNSEISNLVIPIGAVICRFSMIITYSIAAVFTAQLYNVPLDITAAMMIVFLSVLAGIAGAGTPGIVSIAMVSIVLSPLNLPSEAIIVLLLAINPIIEPITTLANIHANCAGTALIAKKFPEEQLPLKG